MGFTIIGQTTSPDVQHQLQIYPRDDSGTFAECGFNATGTANVPDAVVTYFDGVTFSPYVPVSTASGMHAGDLTLTATYLVGDSVRLDAGYPGEPYHVDLAPFAYAGATNHVQLDANNVAFELEWVVLIAW
jgi:hypothetical protein